VLARMRRPDTLDILDGAAEAVLQHPLRAGLAGKPVIERELESLLAVIVDTGEAHQVTGDLAGRVKAAVLALHIQARQFQRQYPLRVVRAQVPSQVKEILVHAARYATHQLL